MKLFRYALLVLLTAVMKIQVLLDVRQSQQVNKVKVQCTLVQALRLCTGRTAHRGSRSIALLFLDHGTRRG